MKDAMYSSSVPVFLRCLNVMDAVLDKGAAYAETKKVDMGVLLGMRLAPDMFTLTKQVQLVSDFAKGISARLAGVDNPKYEDNETTLPQLKERLARTREFIKGLAPAQFADAATRTIAFKAGGRDVSFDGQTYLLHYGLPNFYFHLATAYDILRHAGVDLGKRDFIGSPPQ